MEARGSMRYDLATNLDEKLLEDVIRLDHRHQIKSMYGKLKTDAVGGGRAGFLLPVIANWPRTLAMKISR
jgi:hypothetical protein